MPLKPKQELFCKEYLVDLNATQAAIRAGYSKKTAQQIGSENLLKPVISDRIAELMAERSKRVLTDGDSSLIDLNRVIKDCMKKVPYSDESNIKVMIDHSGALKGIELKMKHLGMFDNKKEDTNKIQYIYIDKQDDGA